MGSSVVQQPVVGGPAHALPASIAAFLAPADMSSIASSAYHLDIDATTLGDKGVIIPARAGMAFVISRYSNMVVAATGTSTTAPSFGYGAVASSFNEIIGSVSQLSTAQINVGAGQMVSNNITGYKLTSSADVRAQITVANIGNTVLVIRVTMHGYWTAL